MQLFRSIYNSKEVIFGYSTKFFTLIKQKHPIVFQSSIRQIATISQQRQPSQSFLRRPFSTMQWLFGGSSGSGVQGSEDINNFSFGTSNTRQSAEPKSSMSTTTTTTTAAGSDSIAFKDYSFNLMLFPPPQQPEYSSPIDTSEIEMGNTLGGNSVLFTSADFQEDYSPKSFSQQSYLTDPQQQMTPERMTYRSIAALNLHSTSSSGFAGRRGSIGSSKPLSGKSPPTQSSLTFDYFDMEATYSRYSYDLVSGISCLPKKSINHSYFTPMNFNGDQTAPDGSFIRVDCGEDAFFTATDLRASWLGVADGVGGWNSMGINPALFAWELMQNAKEAADCSLGPFPWQVLEDAYFNVKKSGAVTGGSSTACIVALDKATGMLHSVNLGDSGFVVFRFLPGSSVNAQQQLPLQRTTKSIANIPLSTNTLNPTTTIKNPAASPAAGFSVIHESIETQHYFNAPYQLAIIPSTISETHRRYFMADTPSDAERASFGPLKHGDLIVMGTDGLFDNLFIEEVSELLFNEFRDVLLSQLPLSSHSSAAESSTTNTEERHSDKNEWVLSMEERQQSIIDSMVHSDEWRQMITEKIQAVAESITREAAIYSTSGRISPFGKKALRHGWNEHFGGKVDDITVISAFVTATKREQPIALL